MFIHLSHVLCLLLNFNVFKATMGVEWRVFEGEELQYDVQSYLVNLEIRNKGELSAMQCSGSMISTSWIITAAHCIDNNLRSVRVIQSTKNGTKGIAKVNEHNVFRHPDFVPNVKSLSNLENDIALLRLKPPIAFDIHIKPIKLSERRPKFGQTALIAGYGQTEDYLDPPREGVVVIVMCPKRTLNHICTRGPTRAGPGDSGGPLVYKEALAGVISSGCENVQINRFCTTVYSSIAFHSDWIKRVTKDSVNWIK